ncbi:protein of unknown function (plasmid) [Pararobbsia alpina]
MGQRCDKAARGRRLRRFSVDQLLRRSDVANLTDFDSVNDDVHLSRPAGEPDEHFTCRQSGKCSAA